MKSIKFVLPIAAGMLLAASAQAQVTINISGAVAFRDTAYRSIRAIYGANLSSENPDTPANPATSLKVTWTGTIPSLFAAQNVTIHAYYNGAVAGIQDLTQNRNVSYLVTSTPGDTNTILLKSDLAFGSVFQQSTAFTTPVLEDHKFGVTPVFFVKSTSTPAAVTNITVQQFRTLAANGALPAWFFTGNTNDTGLIHYVSRDPSAGQRVIVQKENGFTGTPIFYQWDTASSSFIPDPTGRSSTQIRDTLNASGPAISYLTGVDAVNVNGGANILAFNGYKGFSGSYSSVSNNAAPVITGQYTQWGYEHLLNLTTASQNIKDFRDGLLAAIDTDLRTSAYSLPISKVKVARTAEGGPVSPIE
jgi:hypothetical protein